MATGYKGVLAGGLGQLAGGFHISSDDNIRFYERAQEVLHTNVVALVQNASELCLQLPSLICQMGDSSLTELAANYLPVGIRPVTSNGLCNFVASAAAVATTTVVAGLGFRKLKRGLSSHFGNKRIRIDASALPEEVIQQSVTEPLEVPQQLQQTSAGEPCDSLAVPIPPFSPSGSLRPIREGNSHRFSGSTLDDEATKHEELNAIQESHCQSVPTEQKIEQVEEDVSPRTIYESPRKINNDPIELVEESQSSETDSEAKTKPAAESPEKDQSGKVSNQNFVTPTTFRLRLPADAPVRQLMTINSPGLSLLRLTKSADDATARRRRLLMTIDSHDLRLTKSADDATNRDWAGDIPADSLIPRTYMTLASQMTEGDPAEGEDIVPQPHHEDPPANAEFYSQMTEGDPEEGEDFISTSQEMNTTVDVSRQNEAARRDVEIAATQVIDDDAEDIIPTGQQMNATVDVAQPVIVTSIRQNEAARRNVEIAATQVIDDDPLIPPTQEMLSTQELIINDILLEPSQTLA